MRAENRFLLLREYLKKQLEVAEYMGFLFKKIKTVFNERQKRIIKTELDSLEKLMKQMNNAIPKVLDMVYLHKKLPGGKKEEKKRLSPEEEEERLRELRESLEVNKKTLERLGKIEQKTKKVKKEKKSSFYVKISNRFFSNLSVSLVEKEFFIPIKRNLVKANLNLLPVSYISVMFFTTLLSVGAGFLIFLFFLFFNISSALPIITSVKGDFLVRFVETFWILFAVPAGTFFFMYFYPSMEKGVNEKHINLELPFATIHMAAISGSMVEPTRIFEIIIATKDYEYLGKEFTKLLNQVNIYGSDLVSALRFSSRNTASKRLGELFNGIATTIISGGDLPEFFEKRSQTLLFEYRLEKEKSARAAETFMDIYISVVIAAPMILMLLIMMIKVSRLGISMSTSAIALLMVLAVAGINLIFLTFLHLKQSSE